MPIRILTAEEVARALPMHLAIEGMKHAFTRLSTGEAMMPPRSRLDIPGADGILLTMPAYVEPSLAVKVVSVYSNNPARGLPLIYATVLALDAATGRLLALLEGATLTAIRTGAASGAATDALANADAGIVAILGSGRQARTQLEAVATVRRVREARVYSPAREHREAFARETGARAVSSPEDAVSGADIICTATTSATPVFDGRHLRPGAHINAVGSFSPEKQEVDVDTIARSLVVVDSRESAVAEAGIPADRIHAELGEVLAGRKPARSSPAQITYFKSCGLAVQDAVAAGIALEQATARNLGTLVNL
ncbi:MAG: ornithine cyclodeaminase family protein [Acidobacteria bacterium]|nr:ornithine cyclodeaminase family protein [Acidobacteriota bacterium]